jgi:hypothetical protein
MFLARRSLSGSVSAIGAYVPPWLARGPRPPDSLLRTRSLIALARPGCPSPSSSCAVPCCVRSCRGITCGGGVLLFLRRFGSLLKSIASRTAPSAPRSAQSTLHLFVAQPDSIGVVLRAGGVRCAVSFRRISRRTRGAADVLGAMGCVGELGGWDGGVLVSRSVGDVYVAPRTMGNHCATQSSRIICGCRSSRAEGVSPNWDRTTTGVGGGSPSKRAYN